MAMAKKPARSTSDDGAPRQEAASTPKQRARAKLNSTADGPENISSALEARDREAAADRLQQAPGDAVSARSSEAPTVDEIRARAYEMYLERGGHHGLDFDDWVRAERELRQRR
jgi:DUF2934 family protein